MGRRTRALPAGRRRGTGGAAAPGCRLTVTVDWGLAGALASSAPVVVVCDVLSFSTSVSVALDRGATVFPYRWGASAAEFAVEQDAVLAHGRSLGGLTLSPASIRAAAPFARLVLPSPNGATICATLADRVLADRVVADRVVAGRVVLAGCLRNATAVGAWIGRHHPGADVCVVAAGEHRPDGALRPAVEDLWGAGALIAAVGVARTPEAAAAVAAWSAVTDPLTALHACVSGQELDGMGFGTDVDIAAEVDGSTVAPVLFAGAFAARHASPA